MKILLLIDEKLSLPLEEFYQGLHKHIGSVDMRRLTSAEQANLKGYFAQHVDLSKFDRLVMQLNFDSLVAQVGFLKGLEKLVFLDNNIFSYSQHQQGGSDYCVKFYSRLPWARIINSNYTVTQVLQGKGLDIECIPRGYNSRYYTLEEKQRDIPVLVTQDIAKGASNPKRDELLRTIFNIMPDAKMLDNDERHDEEQLKRTHTLVFSDVGRGYYRAKVFEAMAAGCLVVCPNQSQLETRYLGLADMKNIVLFDNAQEFFDKIAALAAQPQLATDIAAAGKTYAHQDYQQFELGQRAGRLIEDPVRRSKDYRVGISFFGLRW